MYELHDNTAIQVLDPVSYDPEPQNGSNLPATIDGDSTYVESDLHFLKGEISKANIGQTIRAVEACLAGGVSVTYVAAGLVEGHDEKVSYSCTKGQLLRSWIENFEGEAKLYDEAVVAYQSVSKEQFEAPKFLPGSSAVIENALTRVERGLAMPEKTEKVLAVVGFKVKQNEVIEEPQADPKLPEAV